jgi:hypothetical protein
MHLDPDLIRLFANAVFGAVTVAFLVLCAVQAVQLAKKGARGAHALGAAFLLIGLGNFRDPTNETVLQAKQLKKREEDDSGDPPESLHRE